MTEKEFLRIAGRLMGCPAAPYHETAVDDEVKAICREARLDCRTDQYGNLFVRLNTAKRGRAFALAAHMDHPGFEIISQRGTKLTARFLGGVPDSYFKPGTPLRLMPDGAAAKLGRRLRHQEKRYELIASTPGAAKCEFAVWELPDFRTAKGLVHGRACDDLIGVAAILATLIELKRMRARVNVIGVISRAEEVGFHGALTVAAGDILPKDALIVSLETSRELPGVKMGQGVIVRVGDRASVFSSDATRFLSEVGTQLANNKRRRFQFQRALMSGGTCEATAYQEFGFETAAVCVALGNYHNCGPKERIAPEFVSVQDAAGMVALLAHAARKMPVFPKLAGKLPKRLDGLLREGKRRLKRN